MTKKHGKGVAGVSRRSVLKSAGAPRPASAPSPGFPARLGGGRKGAPLSRHGGEPVRRHHQESEGRHRHHHPEHRRHTDDVTKRVVTQPNSFDILDTEYFSLKKLVPSGNILPMDAKKIKEFDNITPIFTKGQLPNGKVIGDQGTAPKKVMFLEGRALDEVLEDARPNGSR